MVLPAMPRMATSRVPTLTHMSLPSAIVTRVGVGSSQERSQCVGLTSAPLHRPSRLAEEPTESTDVGSHIYGKPPLQPCPFPVG